MKNPGLKQAESAAQSFWFYNRQPQTEEETTLFNLFDSRGLQVYRRLLKNNRQEVMESIYPLSQKIIGAEWTDLIARYVEIFPPEHFNLNRLAKKFASYLLQYEQQLPTFLPELADYEWLELEVMEHPATVAEDEHSAPDTVEDLMERSPVVNPTVSVREYRFNIQEIAGLIEQDKYADLQLLPQPSWLAACRPPGGRYCEFLGLSRSEAAVLRQAMAKPTRYGELAKLVIDSCAPEQSALQFISTVERFHEAGVFV